MRMNTMIHDDYFSSFLSFHCTSRVLTLLVVVLFHRDHQIVSGFCNRCYVVKRRASPGGTTFLMNSYLDNLSSKPNSTRFVDISVQTDEASAKIGSIMPETKISSAQGNASDKVDNSMTKKAVPSGKGFAKVGKSVTKTAVPVGDAFAKNFMAKNAVSSGDTSAKVESSETKQKIKPSEEKAASPVDSSTSSVDSYLDNLPSSAPTSTGPSRIAAFYDQTKSRTQRIMEASSRSSNPAGQALGAGGVSTYDAFLKAEERWMTLKLSEPFTYDSKVSKYINKKNKNTPPPLISFVTDDGAKGNPRCWEKLRDSSKLDFDVVVCGGTLGIFMALSLQLKGYKVCVLEGGRFQGREQEWNISRKELEELVLEGLLKPEQVESVITTEFPGCRAGFKNEEVATCGGYETNGIGYECIVPDVLNLGVSPSLLLEIVAKRFLSIGGVLKEYTTLKGVAISESVGVALDVKSTGKGDATMTKEPITARLILDCMGNASPISAQQRYGQKPDGICAVVGSCAGGYDPKDNKLGDIIYTNTMIQDKTEENAGKHQYFWETFPVNIGRNGVEESDVKTTYMFTYMDAEIERPSLTTLMEDYWTLLPKYQPSIKDPEKDLDIKRVLFAYFPTYRDSPLKPKWSRLLSIGDASGIQSPLSFGGFGALTRHLQRLSTAIPDALDSDCLHQDDLSLINAYTPNLSAAWMFQKAMSVPKNKNGIDPKFVNRLLATNFEIMNDMGEKTLMPFLQDVVRLDGLLGSLARSFLKDPTFTPQIISHVGVPALVDWMGHVAMIALYTGLHNMVSPVIKIGLDTNKVLSDRDRFRWKRTIEAWEYGSGSDYKF